MFTQPTLRLPPVLQYIGVYLQVIINAAREYTGIHPHKLELYLEMFQIITIYPALIGTTLLREQMSMKITEITDDLNRHRRTPGYTEVEEMVADLLDIMVIVRNIIANQCAILHSSPMGAERGQ